LDAALLFTGVVILGGPAWQTVLAERPCSQNQVGFRYRGIRLAFASELGPFRSLLTGDYALVARHAPLIVDTRNVLARNGFTADHIVKA
jgi:hypothetical protein